MIQQGLFERSILSSLFVMELLLPPLRDRGDDILDVSKKLTLGESLPKKHSNQFAYTQTFDKPFAHIAEPGNVRELEKRHRKEPFILSLWKNRSWPNLKLASQQPQTTRQPFPPMSDTDNKKFVGNNARRITSNISYFSHQHKMTETQLQHSFGHIKKKLWKDEKKNSLYPKK